MPFNWNCLAGHRQYCVLCVCVCVCVCVCMCIHACVTKVPFTMKLRSLVYVVLFLDVELNRLVKKLDRRYLKSSKKGNFKTKERTVSSSSQLCVPRDCSSWAVRPECRLPSAPTRTALTTHTSSRTLTFTSSGSNSSCSSD